MHREPFRPFMIELRNGDQILIDADTEISFPRKWPGLVIAFTAGGLIHEFEVNAIAQLVEAT
jgi:hypothetical protein